MYPCIIYYRYPQCLHFLDLLQSESFRRELANVQCSKFIEEQQLLHWHLYTKKRMQFQQSKLIDCNILIYCILLQWHKNNLLLNQQQHN